SGAAPAALRATGEGELGEQRSTAGEQGRFEGVRSARREVRDRRRRGRPDGSGRDRRIQRPDQLGELMEARAPRARHPQPQHIERSGDVALDVGDQAIGVRLTASGVADAPAVAADRRDLPRAVRRRRAGRVGEYITHSPLPPVTASTLPEVYDDSSDARYTYAPASSAG